MASEAPTEAERKAEQFHTELREEEVAIPTTSGMAMMLQRIINTFRPRTDYSKDWVDQQGEDERIDTAINKFAKHKGVATGAAHRRWKEDYYRELKGERVFVPRFQYFNLVGDDALEEATNELVEDFRKFHSAGTGKARRVKNWEFERQKAVDTYLATLRELRSAERERLEAFQKSDFDDLHLTNAFNDIPLYQVLQQTNKARTGLPEIFHPFTMIL